MQRFWIHCIHVELRIEEDSEGVGDDFFYPSDFEDELDYMVGLEEIFEGVCVCEGVDASSTFEEAFFHLLDFESNFEDGEGLEQLGEADDDVHLHLSNDDILYFEDEHCYLSFGLVMIESFPKHIAFTLANKKPIGHCLEGVILPTFA